MKNVERSIKKIQKGIVVGDKMNKTVVVLVERVIRHSLYGKYIKRRNKYKVHDERNICNKGDEVLMVEARPYSKEKRWRVVEVLHKAV
ncbi:MAG: 30S ribosomal protein S17 [Thermodesulfobacteriota bacterium]